MDVDGIQCKFPRIGNGGGRFLDSSKVVDGRRMNDQYADEEEGEGKRVDGGGGGADGGGDGVGNVDLGGGVGGFYGWASSRIVRVSRASGGKDRHSKVLTSKGLRDRRVRLSVNTAIQFYDLQDRLGYDQPSKAVEWLLKAAASSIAELPPMNSLFPDTPKRLCDERRSRTGGGDQFGFDSAEMDATAGAGGGNPKYPHHQQVTKSSNCSSASETSKGSGLSLSRSESRIKARERAKERVAEKEKKENEPSQVASLNPISHTTSFTELLSAGMNSNGSIVHRDSNGVRVNDSNFFDRSSRPWSSFPMDYFSTGFSGPSATRPGQIHFANSMVSPLFSVSGDNQPEIHQFSFVPDHLVPILSAAAGAGGNANSNNHHHHDGGSNEYNLNFTISSSSNSSSLAGYNGGTLQSNSSSSSSLLPYNLQRFPLVDGSSPNVFIGTTPPAGSQNQFLSGYDARLQLSYGDANANSSQKKQGKN